jgi:hypothetical protein
MDLVHYRIQNMLIMKLNGNNGRLLDREQNWYVGPVQMTLKIPSGQIGSAREWYHWIGLEKDMNRYRFLILILVLNILKDFKVLSR